MEQGARVKFAYSNCWGVKAKWF